MSDPADACAEIVRASRSSFALSFRFLPRRRREGMNAVYAFCRRTDDIVDEPGTPEDKRAALANWRAELNGDGRDPVIRAVRAVAAEFRLDPGHLHAIIDGCEMDLVQSRFETFDDLRLYCSRVAGAVGRLCLGVWGVQGERASEFAEDLGLAVQLTNILRDVGDDANRGRVYLPLDLLGRHGVTQQEVLARRMGDGLRAALAELAGHAHAAYDRADVRGFSSSDRRRLWPAAIIARTCLLLLRRIEARGFPVFEERVELSGFARGLIALRALASWLLP